MTHLLSLLDEARPVVNICFVPYAQGHIGKRNIFPASSLVLVPEIFNKVFPEKNAVSSAAVLRVDVLVDRLVGDRLSDLFLHSPGDLFGRPPEFQFLQYVSADDGILEPRTLAALAGRGLGASLSEPRGISLVLFRVVLPELPRDRGGGPSELFGDPADRPSRPELFLDRFALADAEMPECLSHMPSLTNYQVLHLLVELGVFFID